MRVFWGAAKICKIDSGARVGARARERHLETEKAKGFQRELAQQLLAALSDSQQTRLVGITGRASAAAAGCHFRAQFIIEKVALLPGLLLRNQEYINAPFLSSRFQLCTCKLY